MDPIQHNQSKWDAIARDNDRWFQAVTSQELDAARDGNWKINLTAQKPVPREWLEPVQGRRVLCLAGAGGKQAPILSALGAHVTVLDISHEQLRRDQEVAQRYGLDMETIQGDMSDMSCLNDGQFELIVNPCSICYCPDTTQVWSECFRVLKSGGKLISGMINPVHYLFDERKRDRGKLVVKYQIPYRDLDLDPTERIALWGEDRPLEFGHSLNELIGGLISAGFQMSGFYEDRWGDGDVLGDHIATFFAVKMDKP